MGWVGRNRSQNSAPKFVIANNGTRRSDNSLTISSEAFLYLFLPILLFETAIDIDVRRVRRRAYVGLEPLADLTGVAIPPGRSLGSFKLIQVDAGQFAGAGIAAN